MRPSVAADAPAIRTLFAAVFGVDRPIEHSVWKFDDNPSGAGIGMLAIDAGRIVGQYVVMPTRLRLGRDVVEGAQSLDTMVHPDYRGQGMFVQLANACYELAASRGVEVLYGFPNVNSYPGFIRQLNWHHTGDIARWVRHLDLGKHPRAPRALKPLGRLATRLIKTGNPAAGGVTVRAGRPDAAALDALLGRWRAMGGPCRIERSRDWYDWRFSERSGERYEWLTAYRGSDARALVILNRAASALVDFLGDDAEAMEAATASAVLRAGESGAASISTVTSEPIPIAALHACGFFDRAKVPLIVRALTTRTLPANIHVHENWSINPADLDAA